MVGGYAVIVDIATPAGVEEWEAALHVKAEDVAGARARSREKEVLSREINKLFGNTNVRTKVLLDGTWDVALTGLTLWQVRRIASVLQIPENGGEHVDQS